MDAAVSFLQNDAAEQDALASLEDRIRRAVDLVATLREERDKALADLESSRKAATADAVAAAAENQKLRQEIEGLRSERKQVRTRIEKLLGQMELL